ncbi:hypothetical protein JHL18_02455 [Clostridium sp. YIM B02505]|uniref:Uncharacterized protein n=2 Tax=Clostridium yunnanense TaxID=2800325 RepID=A0ABS1EJG5_9CLOT|nr:hypothetical protein [Clostridium yunnanense]MBK1809506.1 hypothetical protein [Clostridium yunnanense]
MKQIYDFAVKWCDKFRDQNINYIELVDHWMADDCAVLGFEMDGGHAFFEKYGKAANNYEALDRIIDDVKDIPLLGSAIYSQWRYFNHWAYTGAEILEPQNRAWFILALSRLALLSGANPFIFQGTLKKVRIVSNNICYGPMPEPDDEVEQHLTINDEGRVWFSGYNFGNAGERYEEARTKNFKIEKASADKLLNVLAAYFGNEYVEIFATDIGNWVMELTNTEGTTYKFRGSLCADFDYEGIDLSDLMRYTVGMDDLYVFDGNRKPDVINRITLDYHRLTKIKPKEVPEGATWEYVIWDYTEHLIIDRETETLEHIQNIGTGCKVSRKYEIEGGIESLLENFDEEDLFLHIEGNLDDVIDTPNETKDYKITIDYKKNPQRVIEGSYDKNGLPEDFADFAETVFDFIHFYGMGEILAPSVYSKAKRRKSEYIFCSVTFDQGYKSYYYLTDDDSIEVGDFVLVPAGKDNHEAVVEVVNIEYFSEENVPLPVEKTKRIIRKCTDEDFDLPESE